MKLLLIRHGETVDNVAHKYAGVTDSHLTNHGVLQALRLGEHLTTPKSAGGAGLIFTHIFSSDLQRARKTGQAILDAQLVRTDGVNVPSPSAATVTQLFELREVDFGSREGTSYRSSHRPTPQVIRGPGYQSRESNESMAARADRFIDDYLIPAVMEVHFNNSAVNTKNHAIAVASHGIFLGILWMRIIIRFHRSNVSTAVECSGRKPHWSNTGYILLDILPGDMEEGLKGCMCLVEGMNIKTHLQGLERTGGGVGSAKADDRQRQISDFFTPQ
ncbi:uncharacterized protein H6S33_002799 [Morchella sextelata]|uniref:uncharacterized protein n=1 Tax=Morchella sextelata TaxID=1174677 RepID=UPI001D03F926|nr:uncharacterized protein H6S33_002799 [Morchella sextelata]KAH0607765.1 hypothetical protein H6S33_002799 [Morchella sextelata]